MHTFDNSPSEPHSSEFNFDHLNSHNSNSTNFDELDELTADVITSSRGLSPEEQDETPVKFIIFSADSGLCVFSKTFNEKTAIDALLTSGFLSAINKFSSEIFANTVDSVKIGEFTLLLKPVHPFLICYVYKEHSDLINYKLALFSKMLRKNKAIWDALIDTTKTGLKINFTKKNVLEKSLNQIFLSHASLCS
ncbi:MAG: hypothetical protein KAR35_04210 [Candidatus Heimdallarchaeota archaeon]|nr:hypothetical protein [Candidatus Heimdallarchaeota archaeon]MCK5048558.1 hypothetical protein [Candidatus Heimdallarchaeota archaeon]